MYPEVRYLLFALAIGAASGEKHDVSIGEAKTSVSDKFISITIDPDILMGHEFTSTDLVIMNGMARNFAPAYLRVSGPWCQKYRFQPYGSATQDGTIISGETVEIVGQLVHQAGMKLVVCLNPTLRNADGTWNSTEARELLEILHMMDLSIAVELGHERLRNEPEVSGSQMGVDLLTLSSLLEEFPRFRNSPIVAPDITSLKIEDKLKIAEMLKTAGSKIDNVMWHMRGYTPAINPSTEKVGTVVKNALREMARDRREIFEELSFYKAAHKPLWMNDAERLAEQGRFVDAMQFVSKLGHAAQLNVDVVMHSPNLESLLQPSPEFWVSALHKQLVGRTVLDASFANEKLDEETHLFAHCSTQGVSTGGITVFGANYRDEPLILQFPGITDTEVRVYILTPENDNTFSESVLLNKEAPSLATHWMQPIILSPNNESVSLHMPAKSIVFWEIPHARIAACMPNLERGKRNTDLEIKWEEEEDASKSDQEQESAEEKYNCGWQIISAQLPVAFFEKARFQLQEMKNGEEERGFRMDTSSNDIPGVAVKNLQRIEGTSVEISEEDGFLDKARMHEFADPGLSYVIFFHRFLPFFDPEAVQQQSGEVRAKRAAPLDLMQNPLLHKARQQAALNNNMNKDKDVPDAQNKPNPFAWAPQPKFLQRSLPTPLPLPNLAGKMGQWKRDFDQKIEAARANFQRQAASLAGGNKLVLKRKASPPGPVVNKLTIDKYMDAWPKLAASRAAKGGHHVISKKGPRMDESDVKFSENGKREIGSEAALHHSESLGRETSRVKRNAGAATKDLENFEFMLLNHEDSNKVDSIWPEYVRTKATAEPKAKLEEIEEDKEDTLSKVLQKISEILCAVRRMIYPAAECNCQKN